jgi:hypothetical protein
MQATERQVKYMIAIGHALGVTPPANATKQEAMIWLSKYDPIYKDHKSAIKCLTDKPTANPDFSETKMSFDEIYSSCLS